MKKEETATKIYNYYLEISQLNKIMQKIEKENPHPFLNIQLISPKSNNVYEIKEVFRDLILDMLKKHLLNKEFSCKMLKDTIITELLINQGFDLSKIRNE